MSVYTVYEPPQRRADPLAAAERLVFVRDGFHWWAFLLTPLWMLRHRLWLVLVMYLVIIAALDVALHRAGVSAFVITVVGLLISLLVGFEAATLRRFTLRGRGWRNVGIVSGDDLEDAERRFFDSWVRNASVRRTAPPNASTPPPAPSSAGPAASGVIGLFPEPGAQR
ncbi:MAG TPA: DUF2628 domain-containing protein [Xanthobacteraceae bacterium]|nr:DUF2628 domain-containing protein [Xanthobacteraceae bacterium]